MRISEYTLEKKPRYCDHNLDACSVDILDDEDGLGITFKSDKASTWMSQLRHRVVAWSFCQRGQKKSLGRCAMYSSKISFAQRPKVQKFFVHYDGQAFNQEWLPQFLQTIPAPHKIQILTFGSSFNVCVGGFACPLHWISHFGPAAWWQVDQGLHSPGILHQTELSGYATQEGYARQTEVHSNVDLRTVSLHCPECNTVAQGGQTTSIPRWCKNSFKTSTKPVTWSCPRGIQVSRCWTS